MTGQLLNVMKVSRCGCRAFEAKLDIEPNRDRESLPARSDSSLAEDHSFL